MSIAAEADAARIAAEADAARIAVEADAARIAAEAEAARRPTAPLTLLFSSHLNANRQRENGTSFG